LGRFSLGARSLRKEEKKIIGRGRKQNNLIIYKGKYQKVFWEVGRGSPLVRGKIVYAPLGKSELQEKYMRGDLSSLEKK